MEAELTIRGPVAVLVRILESIGALGDSAPVQTQLSASSSAAAQASPQTEVDAVRRVRARCDATWPYVQKIAGVFKSGEELSLADIAQRTGIKMRKVHSIWNVLGRPLKSQNVKPFFVWVPNSSPKKFTLSDAAKAEILKS